jgi:3-oxo-5alpha-steroid 4-dehydrogenase
MTEISRHWPYPATEVPGWDFETDVAIVGFGAAGACAAIEAADAGARVMLFERGSGSGGASALSGGEIYVGGKGGTEVQQTAGFTDSTEDFAAYLRAQSGPCVDEAKCDLYAREALGHYAWLKGQGIPFRGNYLPGKIIEPEDDSTLIWSGSEAAAPFCDIARPAPRGHVVQYMGTGGGRLLMDRLEARARSLGVEVVTDARAVALVRDGRRIVGLVVRIDNANRFVRARGGVVLCTGGFSFNPSMRRRYCPETFKVDKPLGDQDDGSGIEMGVGAGGDAIHMEQFLTTCPWIIPEPQAYGVIVNEAGQRFINEDCYHGRVIRHAVDQIGNRVFLLTIRNGWVEHRRDRRNLGGGRGRAGDGAGHAQRHHGLLQRSCEGRPRPVVRQARADPCAARPRPLRRAGDALPEQRFHLLHARRSAHLGRRRGS